MGIRCSSPSIYLYIETMIGYLYPSKKATPDRVPSYTDHLVSLLSHLTKHLPALTKVQQRNVVTLLTLLLSLLGLTLSFFLYTHVCSCASSHLKLKSIETEEFQVETLEEPASVSSKNYLWVILSFLTRTKDVPEEGGKEIKEMEEIENIKQVKEIDNNSGIDDEQQEVSISAEEVIAAKATYKEKLLNFFRIATRSNTEQDPVIDEIIEEVAAQLEEETVDTILETEAVEELTEGDDEVDKDIDISEKELDEEINLIEEEKTEDDQIQDNNVDVFDESCDNLPEEPSLRDTPWGLLGCGVTTEVEGDSDVDVIEEAAEEIVEVTGEPEEEITESEEDIPAEFAVVEQEIIEEPEIITEVEIEESESHLAEESCDNLPEEPSLRDTLWGFLGCGGATEEIENSVVEDNEEIQIEEATEEISIEEATEEISIEETTEIEIQTESNTEIEAISTYEPETQPDQITEEAEVSVEESCDNLPTEPSLRDKLWSFLGCGNIIEEVANSEEEVIEDEVLSETTHDVEIEQMETDQVDILTTEEPNVEETIVSNEGQTTETLSVPLCLNDSEAETEENVSLQEEVLPADIHLQIKG